MKKTVEILPSAYKYPEITCARINFNGEDYNTINFKETDWKQISDIKLQESKVGFVKICYLEEKPQMDDGPFLKEERELINAIAERLGKVIERFYAEAEATEQKEWLQITLSSIGDAVIATDVASNIMFMNSVAEKLTGWEIQEVKNKNINDIFKIYNEKTGKSAENPVKRVIREGVVVGLANHTVLISKNGTKRNIADSGAPIINKDNKVIGVVLVFRDITEEYSLRNAVEQSKKELETLNKQLEQKVEEKTKDLVKIMEELKKSEEKYRNLYESSKDGIAMVDIEGKFIECNQAYLDMLGYTTEEIKELTYQQLTPEKSQKIDEDIVKNQITIRGYSDEYEKEYYRKDGTTLQANVKVWLIKDKDDNPIGMWRIIRDITERKRVENALRDSEENFRAIAESANDCFFITTGKENFTFVNKRAAEMTGYSISELLKLTMKDILHPDESNKVIERYRKRIEGKPVPTQYETIIVHKNGKSIPIELSATKIVWKGLPADLAIVRDISERKESEENFKKIMEDLKRSNAELEQFAYVASHDLQEPLRMVASFTQLLARRYKDKLDNDANDFINFAVDGATRMQNLINDLLTFSRVGTRSKPFTPTDTNIILKTVLNNLRTQIDETKANISYDPLPVIMADDSQMIQLFQNLISNAIKFHRENVNPEIHMSAEVKKDEWVFYVRDNGIGIDNKFFDRIFIIFQRLHKKDEYGGTGIGLAMCKKIVQRHDGKIWVESEPGKGSTFYFSIPKKEVIPNQ